MTLQAWHTCIWGVSPILLCRRSQALSSWIYSYFKVSLEMFDWVQVWAPAGPLKDIHRLDLKPLLCYLGCVLRVVVLLEGEPSPQRSWAHWSRFSSTISLYFALFIFPLILTSLSVPAAEKHPHSMMLPPPCFTVGMVPGHLQTWCLAFGPNSSILVSLDQIILFLMVGESFTWLLANSKRAVMLLRSGFHLATLP